MYMCYILKYKSHKYVKFNINALIYSKSAQNMQRIKQ